VIHPDAQPDAHPTPTPTPPPTPQLGAPLDGDLASAPAISLSAARRGERGRAGLGGRGRVRRGAAWTTGETDDADHADWLEEPIQVGQAHWAAEPAWAVAGAGLADAAPGWTDPGSGQAEPGSAAEPGRAAEPGWTAEPRRTAEPGWVAEPGWAAGPGWAGADASLAEPGPPAAARSGADPEWDVSPGYPASLSWSTEPHGGDGASAAEPGGGWMTDHDDDGPVWRRGPRHAGPPASDPAVTGLPGAPAAWLQEPAAPTSNGLGGNTGLAGSTG